MAKIDYKELTDVKLFALLKAGDAFSYNELFERYHRLLLRHAFRLLSQEEEAYDVVQDVFLQLWQHREQIVLRTSLSAYLYVAVRNQVFKRIAHEKVIQRYEESIGKFLEEHDPGIDQHLVEKELTRFIDQEIAALPARMREVFVLYKKEELSYDEIAERLQISRDTAKQQVYKAMKILKPKIDHLLRFFVFFTFF